MVHLYMVYPLANIQKVLKRTIHSGFTHYNMVIFHSYVNVYQRVTVIDYVDVKLPHGSSNLR